MPKDPKVENQWQGVDQRTDPLLLPLNTYSNVNGFVYRQGYGARLDGKQLFYVFDSPVISISFAANFAILQTLTGIFTTPLSSLFEVVIAQLQADPDGQILQNDPDGIDLEPNP